ncbi:hypothetical protein ACWDX6_20680 [Streptomyces sp. NPDC003027]
MLDDLDRRGAAVFGSSRGEVNWPYDTPGVINLALRRTDRPAYDREVAEMQAKQEAIVSWAERHGLRASSTSCCLLWLTREVSRRCPSMDTCHTGGRASRSWFHHPLFWLKNGQPAVVTSVSWHFSEEDRSDVDWWTRAFPSLRSERGQGWYGFGTSQVLLWRSDRIRTVRPAWLEGLE